MDDPIGRLPMEQSDILCYLTAQREHFARDYGVSRIGLFGSALRGEMTRDSDIDVLVEMNEPTFDRYMDLKFELEDRFGTSVDLVLSDSLKERIRPLVEKEVVYA